MAHKSYHLKIIAFIIISLFLLPLTSVIYSPVDQIKTAGVQPDLDPAAGDDQIDILTSGTGTASSGPGPTWIPDQGGSSQSRGSRAWLGDFRIVVIATDFPDKNATRLISSINNTVNTGMPDYYAEVSYDQFTITATVANNSWLKMPHNITYYTENNKAKFNEYVTDALSAADPFINFNEFRTTSVYADLIILVHSGQDEATSSNPLDIWSHMSGINPVNKDSTWIRQYCTVSEFSPLGTYVHEFGHLLGLPDLYDNDYSSDGIGLWGLMGAGSHLNGGSTPGHMSAWSKIKLGWLSPTVVSENLFNQPLQDIERNQVVYKVPIPITNPGSDEYFLIANRNRNGYDWYLPASGLMIWHVDDSLFTSYFPNNNENHKLLDVEESTVIQHLDNRADGNLGDSTDLWSGTETGFTPDTDPNSNSYSGSSSKFYLQNIGSAGSTVYADFIVRHIYFEISGGPNRYVAPGSEITVEVNVTSDRSGGDTLDYTLIGSTNSDWAELITLGGTTANENSKTVAKIKVTVPAPEFPNNFCELSLKAHSSDGTEYTSASFRITVGQLYRFYADRPAEVKLDPKEATINSFILFNTGNVKDTFTVTLQKSNGWTVSFWDAGDENPTIDPYSNRTIDIFVEVPQTASAAETLKVTINMVSSATGKQVSVVFNVTVNKIYGLDLKTAVSEKSFDVDPDTKFQYQFTVTNTGNAEDSIFIAVKGVVLTGSAAGLWSYSMSPSDTAALQPAAEQKFILEVTVPSNALAGIKQEFDVTILSEDGVTNKTFTIDIAVNQISGMNAVLDSYTKTAKPLNNVVFIFKITNTGNGNDTYNISLSTSLPEGWTLIYPDNDYEVVEPGKTRKYTLTLVPPRLATAAEHKFTLKVKSLGDDSMVATFTETVTVERVHSVWITVITTEPLTGRPGESLNYSVTFENLGNDEETLMLSSATARHGMVIFKSSLKGNTITTLTLNAGESKTIIVMLSLYESLEESVNGAVQIYGTLGDSSRTNEPLLYYSVNATTADDTNGDKNGDGTDTQGIFSGESGLLIVLLIVIVIIFIILALFIMLRKKSKDKKPTMAQVQVQPYGNGLMLQQQAQYMQYPAQHEPQVFDAQVVDAELAEGAVTGTGPQMTAAPAGYDPVTGEVYYEQAPQLPPQQGSPEDQPGFLGYDGETGEPIFEEESEIEFESERGREGESVPETVPGFLGYDGQTGEPIYAEVPGKKPKKRFDPQTGEPL